MKKPIGQGAEAVIYLDKNITKDRIKKNYRIKEIDEKLRGFRTRREAKILDKLAAINFPAPRLIRSNEKDTIEMEFIDGKKMRDVLEEKDYTKLSKDIGKKIAVLHNNNIIHGDLTTSNMILKDEIYLIDAEKSKISGISKKNEIFFIDFGLSFFSHKIEDMAVDLHLLRQALESKHYKIYEKCFDEILKSYKEHNNKGDEVIARLGIVEKRGRYKGRH